jgi:hypothetical protein
MGSMQYINGLRGRRGRGRDRMVVGSITTICNQCLSPLTMWVRITLRRGVLDTTLCDKVYQWLAAGRWFSLGTPVSFTNENSRHDVSWNNVECGVKHHNPNPDSQWVDILSSCNISTSPCSFLIAQKNVPIIQRDEVQIWSVCVYFGL